MIWRIQDTALWVAGLDQEPESTSMARHKVCQLSDSLVER